MTDNGEHEFSTGQQKLVQTAHQNIEQLQQMQNQMRVLIDRTRAVLARLLAEDQPKDG
jgi:hypothetical protein